MMKKTIVRTLLSALLAMSGMTAAAQNSYFVTTHDDQQPEQAADTVQAAAAPSSLTPEERFLAEHFPTLTLCDWQPGMRFMVIPGEMDAHQRTFTDSLSGNEVDTGSLRHRILTYSGHNTNHRGRELIRFYCEELQKTYYFELRNFTFSDYCHKASNGGVRALAYLGDVDKARELLLGKELYTRGDRFYVDDSNASDGMRETFLAENTHVTVDRIGVGTRDFPVKIVVRTDDGKLYFQCVAMSRINCSLVDDNFYREQARHLFAKSFAFESLSGKNGKDADNLSPFRSGRSAISPTTHAVDDFEQDTYASMVSGIVSKGMTMEQVKLIKGEPDRVTRSKGDVTWTYFDGRFTFRGGRLVSIYHDR